MLTVILGVRRIWNFNNKSLAYQPVVFSLSSKAHTKMEGEKTLLLEEEISSKAHTKMEGEKRPLLEEEADPSLTSDENWIKRIKIDPVCVPNTVSENVKIKKRKFILQYSYCGQNYYGLQVIKNNQYPTIEMELFNSLLKAKLVTEECILQPQSFHYQRSCRTDKGVSAARNISSAKLPENVDSMVEKVNSFLPEHIRMQNIIRSTKHFNAKNSCDERTYSYLTPTFAFSPVNEIVTENYRITPVVLEEIKSCFEAYIGTRNFHNFTSGVKHHEMKAKRHIKEITLSDPFVVNNMEFLQIKIRGQSFMIHQIRKMVAFVIGIAKSCTTVHNLFEAFGPIPLDIPIAPGLGLWLEEPHYHNYNERISKTHERISWDEAEIEKFKEKYIVSKITSAEKETSSMLKWLATLYLHSFEERVEGQNEPIIPKNPESTSPE